MTNFVCPICGKPMDPQIASRACIDCMAAAEAIASTQEIDHVQATAPKDIRGDSLTECEPIPSIRKDLGSVIFRGASVFVVVAIGLTCLGFLMLSTQKLRDQGPHFQRINNMKQLLLACHAHHDIHKHLPSPKMFVVNDGKHLEVELSWRVTLLPLIEQGAMFNAFDKSLGWDDKKNVPFQTQKPSVYHWFHAEETISSTPNQYFTGPRTLYPGNENVVWNEIKDGSSNTMLMADALKCVIWTQPADMAIRTGVPLPLPEDRFYAGLADGSVRTISRQHISDTILRQLINPSDGKPDPGWE